jgi:hypothetical protein
MKHLIRALVVTSILLICAILWLGHVYAQSAKAGTLWGQGPSSTCDTSIAGGPAGLCIATDGIFTNAGNGALWVKMGGAQAGGITGLTYNGTPVPVTNGVAAITGPTKAVIPNGSLQ